MSVDEVARLMLELEVTGLPVMHGGVIVGVITQADLVVRLGPRDRLSWWTVFIDHARLARECQQARGATVGEVMSRPAVVASPDDPLEVAARLLQEYRIGRLPVLDHGRLVGIVTHSDCCGRCLDRRQRRPRADGESRPPGLAMTRPCHHASPS